MTNELEKQFFDTFGIECNISFHQQFNGAQIPRGLEFYKKREELAKTGIIKIWHKMLNPRPENYCVYWGEYHYPTITDRILLQLQEILLQHNINVEYSHFNDGDYYCSCSIPLANGKGKTFKEAFLDMLISIGEDYAESCCYDGQDVIYNQVRTLFEEG